MLIGCCVAWLQVKDVFVLDELYGINILEGSVYIIGTNEFSEYVKIIRHTNSYVHQCESHSGWGG